MEAEQLSQIIQWVKAGKTAEARQALRQQLQHDPGDERAWLWLAETMAETSQRIAVLEHALKSVPDSELLRRSLARLKIQQFAQAIPVSEVPGSEEDNRTLPVGGIGYAAAVDEQAHQDIATPLSSHIIGRMDGDPEPKNPPNLTDHPPSGQKAVSKGLSPQLTKQDDQNKQDKTLSEDDTPANFSQQELKRNERVLVFKLALIAALFILIISLFILVLWRGI